MSQSFMSSDGPHPPTQEALVGGVGQEYVQSVLSTTDPATAVDTIQRQAGLPDARCRPLLLLLDQLGVSRADAHQAVLEKAKSALLARVPSLTTPGLLTLLEASFPFVGIPELRAVPLAVLGRLAPVPATFLKQLATDAELFEELPRSVQRQVWELDKKLLQGHAVVPVAAYTTETATLLRALDMDECLPPALVAAGSGKGGAGRPLPPPPPRKLLRRGSAALQTLVDMVGRSRQVYKGVVELCVVKYRDAEGLYVGTREAAFCSLRAQLLMALHDAGATELCSQEACHKLAWTLDACLNDRTLDARRLRELRHFFALHDTAGAQHRRPHSGGNTHRHRHKSATAGGDDAESAGAPGVSSSHGEEVGRVLGDAGMVLRDPSTSHLLAHQVVRQLEAVVAAEGSPGDDQDLLFMTRLLQLAAAAKGQLRARKFGLPEPESDIVHTFYPLLAGVIMEAQMRSDDEDEDIGSAELESPDEALIGLLIKHEVVRRVTQVYTLERLAAGDMAGAAPLLAALAAALGRLHKGAPEWAPFAATLARRATTLLGAGRLQVGGPLWDLVLNQILLRTVDTETQVHEEVLRLLLAAATKLDPAVLGRYLQSALQNSRKSRRRFKRRRVEGPGGALPVLGGGYSSGGYSSAGGLAAGYRSPAFGFRGGGSMTGGTSEGGEAAGGKGADGVRATYQLFQQRAPGLNPSNAPAYFQYLSSA